MNVRRAIGVLAVAAGVLLFGWAAHGAPSLAPGCSPEFIEQLQRADATLSKRGFALGKHYTLQCVEQAVIDEYMVKTDAARGAKPKKAGSYRAMTIGAMNPQPIFWSKDEPFRLCLLVHERWHGERDPERPGHLRDHDENGNWHHTFSPFNLSLWDTPC